MGNSNTINIQIKNIFDQLSKLGRSDAEDYTPETHSELTDRQGKERSTSAYIGDKLEEVLVGKSGSNLTVSANNDLISALQEVVSKLPRFTEIILGPEHLVSNTARAQIRGMANARIVQVYNSSNVYKGGVEVEISEQGVLTLTGVESGDIARIITWSV